MSERKISMPMMIKAKIHWRAKSLVPSWAIASARRCQLNRVGNSGGEASTRLSTPGRSPGGSLLTERQDSKLKAHGIVLEPDDKESSIEQPSPDEDVCHDSCRQILRVYHRRTGPEQRHKGECQWPGNDRDVDETRSGGVAEVEVGQVEEVEDEDEFTLPEVATHPAHDETEVEEVIEDEMGADVACRGTPFFVGAEEVVDVASL